MNTQKNKAFLADAYPGKAQYQLGEDVDIFYEIDNTGNEFKGFVEIKVSQLERYIVNQTVDVSVAGQCTKIFVFTFKPPFNESHTGFGVDIRLYADGEPVDIISTAFDTAKHWYLAPRYGFLSDFSIEDEKDENDIKQMEKYHINAVQYYDWMYRHDTLIPPEDYFVDPLGRKLSLPAVRNKVASCRKYGMHSIAYGAIYGASRDFYEKHRDWALYNNKGEVEAFGEWLYIMNVSPECPWSDHIVDEYAKCIEEIGFDGIHMDTYGAPKTDYSKLNGKTKFERLEEHFPLLIEKAHERLRTIKEDACLIFNAVNNWPVDKVAPSGQNAVYVEVWPPNDKYAHLYNIIKFAREIGKKQVILAAYLKPFKDEDIIEPSKLESCFCLASAVIFASGGYHLLLGENNKILSDPYYVKHSSIPGNFIKTVRNYYDFIVRYANLLFDLCLSDISMTFANGINDDILFENGNFSSCGEPDKVWTIIKEKPGCLVINFINLVGIKDDRWNEPKEIRPVEVYDITVKALINEPVKGIFTASPDIDDGRISELDFSFTDSKKGRYTVFRLPELINWGLIFIIT